jgi:small neutral amino acid transporter SnatA (MarC family)
MRIFGIFMVVVYALLGILFLFVINWPGIPKTNLRVAGGILLLYAAFRTYMVFQRQARERSNDKE